MNLLVIKNEALEISPEALAIKAFRKLWTRTRAKVHATKEISVVYFYCDYRSPYSKIHEEERMEQIKIDVFGDIKWEPDEDIFTAIKKYQELQITPSMSLLIAAREATQSIATYYKDIVEKKKDANGNTMRIDINDIGKLTKALKETGGILETLNKLEKQVKEEITAGETITGGGDVSAFEDPESLSFLNEKDIDE